MTQLADVPSYVDGNWVTGDVALTSVNPSTGEPIATAPGSSWSEINRAIEAGVGAYETMRDLDPEQIAGFLEAFATQLESDVSRLTESAHLETGLPIEPRLAVAELPRTTDQLRQAASAARHRSWTRPTVDSITNVRSMLTPLPGPVVTFGPNNFPLAFSSIAGGDAAAALATGHPVIAKAHPSHIRTSALLLEGAVAAAEEMDMPAGIIQLLYHVEPEEGLRLVADRRIAATGFTGGRETGLALKSAADLAGVPIFLEMSSVNPIVVLPDAARLRRAEIASTLVQSINLGAGQFCTKPGIIFTLEDSNFETELASQVDNAKGGDLMSEALCASFNDSMSRLKQAGAVTLGASRAPDGPTGAATWLLRLTAAQFRGNPIAFQEEAFGPGALVVACTDFDELESCLQLLDGNLTGTIFATDDDQEFNAVRAILEPRVGRIAVNKAPTGVQVVPAMNHGGPFPATGQPSFTSVGIPRALERFAKLTCYDGAPDHRLPPELQDSNPLDIWRQVDGRFTKEPL